MNPVCLGERTLDAFVDDEGSVHEDAINCAAHLRLVNGTSLTTFSPDRELDRGQSATLLVQFVERAGDATLGIGEHVFSDTAGNIHDPNIQKAYYSYILSGFPDGTYRPEALVTREQFASVVVQAVEEVLLDMTLPNDDIDRFDDDDGSVHELNIEKAADNGVVSGTGPRLFGPRTDVTRGQAASIIVAAVTKLL